MLNKLEFLHPVTTEEANQAVIDKINEIVDFINRGSLKVWKRRKSFVRLLRLVLGNMQAR